MILTCGIVSFSYDIDKIIYGRRSNFKEMSIFNESKHTGVPSILIPILDKA